MLRRFIATILALTLTGAAGLRAQDTATESPKPALPPVALPPAGGSVDLGLEGATRAVRLRVERASLSDRHGSLAPAAGASFLVLDTTWTNVISATLVQERGIPAEYRVPNLEDHLYLVLDGSRLARIHPGAGGQPEHVPAVDFAVPAGAQIRGKILFEVPPGGATSVELRYYDWAHGHLSFPLVQPASPVPAVPPIGKPQANEVLEAAVHGIRSETEIEDRKAPDGFRFVLVDLRARSKAFMESDATAFNPAARAGSKVRAGTVADWKECRRHIQLVIDGEYGCAPFEPLTTLAAEPRFLPDVATGGQVAFLAPAGGATSLEVRLDFPGARTADGKVVRPDGLTLLAEGRRPSLTHRLPIAGVRDDTIRVEVFGQRTAGEFAGARPSAGRRFLILDVVVTSTNEIGETFQPARQLVYHAEHGRTIELDRASYAAPRRPEPILFVPGRERRRFEAAFQIPASDSMPRLGYSGFAVAEVMKLTKIEEASTEVAVDLEQPGEEPGPAEPAPGSPHEPAPGSPHEPAPGSPHEPAPAGRPLKSVDSTNDVLRVKVRPALEAKGIAGVGLTADEVNQAIDRGAAGLWGDIKEDLAKTRRELGQVRSDVLAALALIHCGAHRRFPDFHARLREWLAAADPARMNQTYDVGILCMVIEAYGDPSFLPLLRRSTRWLLENQGPNGTWAYGRSLDWSKDPAAQLDRRVLRVAGGRPLDGTRPTDEMIEKLGLAAEPSNGDNSVTQYAVLGLHAASRAGIKVPADVWKKVLAETLARQVAADGGWDYTAGAHGYGSMTCAGICTAALARHESGEPNPAVEVAIERGLAWLARTFTVSKNPGHEQDWLYYYLYSLERVGRILDTEFIGRHEWYPEGARFLVQNQRENGTWVFGKGYEMDPRLCTSFALFFLTRATPSLAPEERKGPGTLVTGATVPPSVRLYIIMDCSGSMLEAMGGRQKFEIAREAVASLVKNLPDHAELGLRLYGYRRRAIEEGASEDTNLIMPMARLDRKKFDTIIQGVRARGKTPLALSLEQAARDIGSQPDARPVTVVLLTDGGEDTLPRKDPIKASAAFAKLGNVHLKIVGFDINRADWQAQLAAMASAAGAQYLPAAEAGELIRELKGAVFGTPEEYVLLDAGRAEIARGRFGDSRPLDPGKYYLRTMFAGRAFGEEIWINAGTTTAVTFDAANIAATLAEAAPPGAEPGPVPPPATLPRFCTGCGAKLAPAAKFCSACGAKTGG